MSTRKTAKNVSTSTGKTTPLFQLRVGIFSERLRELCSLAITEHRSIHKLDSRFCNQFPIRHFSSKESQDSRADSEVRVSSTTFAAEPKHKDQNHAKVIGHPVMSSGLGDSKKLNFQEFTRSTRRTLVLWTL